MSVLIKDMEMPTSCMDCPFKGFDRARGRGNICTINDSITLHVVLDGMDVKIARKGDCPLQPLVRCGNCRYHKEDKHGYWCYGFCSPPRLVRKDDFCSYGC